MANRKIHRSDLLFLRAWIFDATQEAEDRDERGKNKALAGDARARRVVLWLLGQYEL